MRFLKFLASSFIFVFLTILTQVGGLVYLLSKLIVHYRLKKKPLHGIQKLLLKGMVFSVLLLLTSIVIVPPIAQYFGRVPLPWNSSAEIPLKPANWLTCVFNRHYVKPDLLELIQDIAKTINKDEQRHTELIYLDANFPFIDNFPLLPHKSHDDGEKLDIAFLLQHKTTEERLNDRVSFTGYGVCILPEGGETDMPAKCAEKGYFQYSLLQYISSQAILEDYELDKKANKRLLLKLLKHPKLGKIFIEPHLKERLGLGKWKKIRFHGCGAVRHDDHIHLQL